MNVQLENKLSLVSGSTCGHRLSLLPRPLPLKGARVIVNGRTDASLPVFATVMKTRFKEFDEALKQLEEQMKKQ